MLFKTLTFHKVV